MSIDFLSGPATRTVSWNEFTVGQDLQFNIATAFFFSPTTDNIKGFVNEFADDGSVDGAYSSLAVKFSAGGNELGGAAQLNFDIPSAFFETHVGTSISFEIVLNLVDPNSGTADAQGIYFVTLELLPDDPKAPFNSPGLLHTDYFAITRLPLSSDQATTENQAIMAGTTTERVFVDKLLSQVADTTIPALAVEGSMYGAVGTSDEVTKLATLFLPAQVANATQLGLDPQVYACEALGLAFAFGDENGGTAFAKNFGPTVPGMSASPGGDAFFAAAAASAIFGSAATQNTPGAIAGFVANWKSFYTTNGLPGVVNATPDQIDLAARGAAWGDAVGVAVANNLGPLPGQVINFLEDAARGGAVYSKSLATQPAHAPFQGGIAEFLTTSAEVGLTGVAAPDHMLV